MMTKLLFLVENYAQSLEDYFIIKNECSIRNMLGAGFINSKGLIFIYMASSCKSLWKMDYKVRKRYHHKKVMVNNI